MTRIFLAAALLFGASLINAQATPLTAFISRFAPVQTGINLDTGLVLWLDASNLSTAIASPQGNVLNWQSSNVVNNQSLVFSAPSNAQAPQLILTHSRFPGYPVSNLRFVRSLSQFYQFSPKLSQEFPTNFENGITIFSLSAFGFAGSAGPGSHERIYDFSAGPNAPTAILVSRIGVENRLFACMSNVFCETPYGVNIIPSGESVITRVNGQPNGRLQITVNGNEATGPACDMAMGPYTTVSRTATAYIGKSNWANDLLEGSISEILVWNRILSSAEMSFVYSYLNAKSYGCGPGGFGAHPSCTACPVNTSSSLWGATTLSQCQPCQNGSSTEGLMQRSACVFPITVTSKTVALRTPTAVSTGAGPGNELPTTLPITTPAADSTANMAMATLTSTLFLALSPSVKSAEPANALSSGDFLIVAEALGSAALLVLVGVGAVLIRRRRIGKVVVIKPTENGMDFNNPYAGPSRLTEGTIVPFPLWGNSMAPATNQNISVARPTPISMARPSQGQYYNPSTNMAPMFQSMTQSMTGGQMYSTAGRPLSVGTFNASPNMPGRFSSPQSMYFSRSRPGTTALAGQWQGTQFQ